MNCNIFHQKIHDLIEDDCPIDFKNIMEQHRDSCKGCKAYYDEELKIHKDFQRFFSIKDTDFKSSRVEIIKGINKNQYKNNYLVRIYTHFNKHKRKYTAWVAVFAIIFILVPKFSKLIKIENMSLATSNSASKSDKSKVVNTAGAIKNNLESFNIITFKKITLKDNEKIADQGTWKKSADGKYSACVSGVRGIYVKVNNTGTLFSYIIDNNLRQQDTPMFLEWYTKNNTLMVIIGKKVETNDEGGDIYRLDLTTSIAKLIYKSAELEKVKNFKVINEDLNAEIIVYEDSNFVKYHIQNINIPSKDINKW